MQCPSQPAAKPRQAEDFHSVWARGEGKLRVVKAGGGRRGGRGGGGLGRGLGRGCCLKQGPEREQAKIVYKRSGGRGLAAWRVDQKSDARCLLGRVHQQQPICPIVDQPRTNRQGGLRLQPGSPCLKNADANAVGQSSSRRGGSQTWLGRVGRGKWNRDGWRLVALPRSRVSGSGTFRQ